MGCTRPQKSKEDEIIFHESAPEEILIFSWSAEENIIIDSVKNSIIAILNEPLPSKLKQTKIKKLVGSYAQDIEQYPSLEEFIQKMMRQAIKTIE